MSASCVNEEAMVVSETGDTLSPNVRKDRRAAETWHDVRDAVNLGEMPPSDEPEQTDFTELTGTIQFKDGLGTNNDLSIKSPLLRILGKGSARASLEGQIRELGLSDRVSLPGWVRPVWDELVGATIFALPSRYAGCSRCRRQSVLRVD